MKFVAVGEGECYLLSTITTNLHIGIHLHNTVVTTTKDVALNVGTVQNLHQCPDAGSECVLIQVRNATAGAKDLTTILLLITYWRANGDVAGTADNDGTHRLAAWAIDRLAFDARLSWLIGKIVLVYLGSAYTTQRTATIDITVDGSAKDIDLCEARHRTR